MDEVRLSSNMTVGDLMVRYPDLVSRLVRQRIVCAGCPMARFCTLADVTAVYGVDRLYFEQLLEQVQPTTITDRQAEGGIHER